MSDTQTLSPPPEVAVSPAASCVVDAPPAEPVATKSEDVRRTRSIPAWLVSANVHLVLLLVLATQTAREDSSNTELAIIASAEVESEFDDSDFSALAEVSLTPEDKQSADVLSDEPDVFEDLEAAALPEPVLQKIPSAAASDAKGDGLGQGRGAGGAMAVGMSAIGTPARAAAQYKQLRVGVTDWKYDNIPEVLDNLGIAYRHVRESDTPLDDFDVIFIGCGGGLSRSQASPQALRRFVERGGVLYVSDLSGGVLRAAFADEFGPKQHGPNARRATCLVVNDDLEAVLGKRIRIHFNLPGWLYFPKPSSDVDVLLRLGSVRGHPLVLRLEHGEGRVVFTSFHNHNNLSSAERMLVRSLVTELPRRD